jgi:DNA-binding cell septation regulator SpoVG
MTFIIDNPKLINRGSLLGSFDITLPSGLIIHDCKLFEKGASRWIGLPSREYIKNDGTKSYFPLVEFRDREVSDRFRDACMPHVIEAFKTLEPAPEPSKQESTRGHWSGPADGPSDIIEF